MAVTTPGQAEVVEPTATAAEPKRTWIEEVATTGEELVGMVKRLVTEGNVRRVTVSHNGHVVVELPLTVGVVGALLAPQVAALGAIAALVTSCTIKVERETPPASGPAAAPPEPSGSHIWVPGQPEPRPTDGQ